MPLASLLCIVAAVVGPSVAIYSNGDGIKKGYAAHMPLQIPIDIPPLSISAAETCSGGTLTQTSTDTTVITVTPSLETTTITVTATAPTATDTHTETTVEHVTSASTSTSTASLPAVTRTTAITCFLTPGAITTTSEACITTTTTRTVTDSTTLAVRTTTSTDTTTITPSTSTTTTSTSTVSTSTTTTVTITPAPATTSIGSVSPTGLKYYDYYPRAYTSGSNFFANVPAIVNGVGNNDKYNISGSVRNINALVASSNGLNFPDGKSAPGSSFACIFQGYFYPALGAGTYTINSRNQQIDDVGIVWTGDKALGNNWNYTNFDYGAEWPTTGRQLPTSGSVSFYLGENESKAMTIFWGNVDGPGRADFVVTFGSTTYTNTSQFFVGPCDGSPFNP